MFVARDAAGCIPVRVGAIWPLGGTLLVGVGAVIGPLRCSAAAVNAAVRGGRPPPDYHPRMSTEVAHVIAAPGGVIGAKHDFPAGAVLGVAISAQTGVVLWAEFMRAAIKQVAAIYSTNATAVPIGARL